MPPHTIPNPLQFLESALNQCAETISAISSNQADWPTPCVDWSVQDLLHHLVVQDLHKFTIMARGHNVDPPNPEAMFGADWSTRFSDGATLLMRAWSSADLSAQVALPGGGEAPLRSRIGLQISEFTVHAWDLVKATGVPIILDPVLADQSLAWAQRMLKPEYRDVERGIGPEVRVPVAADPYARLAGWFGRSPYFKAGPRAASLR
ncbi:TIGR03086 family metal-binding protein [Arthrobacter antibioticus]|uniref:TIGR03086 family metal-binding protein n=1 Tax=Arthrobacter sp. H35-MC1 TaxID=3046203 RepID=UPI0024B9A9B1|nr:TIGR03086 family metal-binding protein [Arthrobacter sp. H35-MC1]MDJ0316521.1 TIGR03086 family metal-binding protein [Arthrobacter sp. H35-MC1]